MRNNSTVLMVDRNHDGYITKAEMRDDIKGSTRSKVVLYFPAGATPYRKMWYLAPEKGNWRIRVIRGNFGD